MVLKTMWYCLFLTILSNNFYTGVAEETKVEEYPATNLGQDSNQQNLRHRIELFIKAQVHDYFSTKIATTKSAFNINKDVEEIADKTILQLIIDAKQIINKISLVYLETKVDDAVDRIDNRVDGLEIANKKMKVDIQKLSEDVQELLNNEHKTPDCVIDVPSDIKTRSDIWTYRELPKNDDLDTFMTTTRGCSYKAVKFYFEQHFFPEQLFDGTKYELNFAVRTKERAHMKVLWATIGNDYSLEFGENDSTKLKNRADPSSSTLATASTPLILSEDNYSEFYIRIDQNTLSFGKICSKPLITHNISIKKNDKIQITFESYTDHGGKVIYGCRDRK